MHPDVDELSIGRTPRCTGSEISGLGDWSVTPFGIGRQEMLSIQRSSRRASEAMSSGSRSVLAMRAMPS
jgi:hypothetical protein